MFGKNVGEIEIIIAVWEIRRRTMVVPRGFYVGPRAPAGQVAR
jgi:hypothetical protein